MSFTEGLNKTAKSLGSKITETVKTVAKGAKSSGSETIGDTLKLKGLRHITDTVKRHGGVGMMLHSPHSRSELAHSVGKAAPSLAMAALYGTAANKVRKKMRQASYDMNEGYHTYHGG